MHYMEHHNEPGPATEGRRPSNESPSDHAGTGRLCRVDAGCQGILRESMNLKAPVCGGLMVFALSLGAQTIPDPTPEANPARPTVSTPATLTPVGYLQFET